MGVGTITKRSVEALAPGCVLWDSALPGFGVRRQRDLAVYVIKYRFAKRQRFYTIGAHGRLTPEQARRKAKQLLGAVAEGRDPADEKAEATLRAADTLGSWVDRYLAYAKGTLRPKTYTEVERYLRGSPSDRRSVEAAWKPMHSTSVWAIRRRHVAARLAEITKADGSIVATCARRALSTMFNWAIREGLEIEANPVAGTNRPAPSAPRKRVLTDNELRAVWLACTDDDFGRIIRLLILTGQRRDEVGGMRWSELAAGVDPTTLLPIPGTTWRIPGTRTKNHRDHIVPLSRAALALLPPRREGDFVFGRTKSRAFSGWSRAKVELDERCGVQGWRIHDLRRTAATMLADRLGVLPHIIEAILNHASGHRAGVAGVYNLALYEADMRVALGHWAQEVARIVAGRPRSVTSRRRTAAYVT